MNLWQKLVLAFANLVAALVPLAFVLLVYSATCGNSIVSLGAKATNIASFGYIQDFCAAFKGPNNVAATIPPPTTIAELDIVLTSAYRPNSFVNNNPNTPSAHGRGEAFDIALRNPTVPLNPNPVDPRIAQLILLGESLGFTEPTGNVVDEYNKPSSGTEGAHIHIEFNAGQCRGTAANPPTDLVPIPPSIPKSGVSDARVRSCMLPYLMQLFQKAGVIET